MGSQTSLLNIVLCESIPTSVLLSLYKLPSYNTWQQPRSSTTSLPRPYSTSTDMSNAFAAIAAQQQAAAAAAAANPVFYIPASRREEIRAYTVLKIYAVCHPKSAASGSGKTNHWTLSLDIGNGRSVRLDIQPNPQQSHTNGGSKALIVLSLLDYVVTNNAVRHDAVSVTYSRPVSWYIDYLASGGRFKYALCHSPRKKSVAERGSPILYNFWLMLERSIASNQNRQDERSHIFGLTPNLLGLQLVSTSRRDMDMTQRHLVPHIRLATHF
jgi:hypothetical protein